MTDDAPFAWAVVVPVKVLAHAKSRIAPLAGPRRAELALAMASDTVRAVVASRAAAQVIVVTDDPVAAQELAAVGATVVPDEPRAGLNAALSHGAACAERLWPGSALAALSADLPALQAAELLPPGIAGLRQDVDTPEDLRAAARLGLGPRTAALAAELLRAAG